MYKTTACALDCYDACKIVVEEEISTIKGDNSHPVGNGALCRLLNQSIYKQMRIESARVEGKEVSIDEAMQALKHAFEKSSSLLWRGSGNMGVMQEVTNLFMDKINGTLTHGSLCDGAGNAGIVEGRGVNKNLPLEQIAKADTVVVWGRNVTVTNAHIMPFLEGKNIVVIDPVKTAIAKKADFHLQIQPRTDYYLAIMLARFIYMENSQDTSWLEAFASEYEYFYEFTQEHRIKAILEYIGTDLGELGHILNYLRNQKVVFLVGTGVQKYSTGSSTLHAIDSLAALLGLFGKEGCGVHYLGNSKLGFKNLFDVKCKTVSKVVTKFSEFDTVLVQGGNPVESMPDSTRVCEELDKVENLIYFGLYENETSKRAKIVIPAKNFFEKEDVRLSYGHQYIEKMNKVIDSEIGISEYDFTKKLFTFFDFDGLQSEEAYINSWLEQCEEENNQYISPAYEAIPYVEGFGEEGGDEFTFIEEYDDEFINTKSLKKVRTSKQNEVTDNRLWLLTPKSNKSLNTQFQRETSVSLHPALGYENGEKVRIVSNYGEVVLDVVLSKDVRENCIVITSNTLGVNKLTPSIVSNEGENACYQEVKVSLESV
ncbi:Anaerobic dehydrogenases, typically selenocysteine-containing [hydrothermal vent metagenome]|uniref:Anaerobic dehydrogenases, typically selenocysteine-containing n=1 Tax=hydrothermal vent metagenome TaxID=652676 RepID=A0A1W1C5T6_9ZZZZ